VFERFTDRARRVLVLAQEEARMLNHSFIGTEHILLGLLDEGDGVAAQTLESLDISIEAVRRDVELRVGPGKTAPTGPPPFTPRAKKVLELALREALQLGHNYIGTEHMLLGLLREGEGVAAQVLLSLGTNLSLVRVQVIELLTNYTGPDPVGASVTGPTSIDGPRCPYCGVSLVDHLRHRTLESTSASSSQAASVEADEEAEPEAGSAPGLSPPGPGEGVRVFFAYCGACGKALGIARSP
jgi:ATP-dependent Clp protease ATP-binding subunit ClpA